MQKFMAVVPALASFGPLLMVIGLDSQFHLTSIMGAFMTSAAILIVFARVQVLSRDNDSAVAPQQRPPR
jgi:hypothetical protein